MALAFGLGIGLTPKLPGTVGTLLAIPLWWWLSNLDLNSYLLITACAFLFGIWICQRASERLGQHDHSGIVFDEIVGYLLALVVVPVSVGWLLLSFVLFRFFDVVKPWPICWLDRRIKGGLGVMLDDLAAGIFTAVIILAARAF
ncbi:MAG: phosphatidylglycerophosphatase A [Arenicellales bacterium]|nr:phosphatidylglycerophosphatase A [Arenicellales bacterium]